MTKKILGMSFTLRCLLIEYAVALTFGQFYHEPTPADFHPREKLEQVLDRHDLLAQISGRALQLAEN